MSNHDENTLLPVRIEATYYSYLLVRFPLPDALRSDDSLRLGWDRMLAWTESAEQVAEALRQQAELIRPNPLRAFARRLLGMKPAGVLCHAEGSSESSWLVLSNLPEPSVCSAISEGGRASPYIFFLERVLIPPPPRFPEDDVVQSFFWSFGGLRDAPPGYAGFFNTWPARLTEIFPGDSEMYLGTIWEGATELYTSDCGDWLVLARNGSVGWRLHDESLRIVPCYDSFEEAIDALLAGRMERPISP